MSRERLQHQDARMSVLTQQLDETLTEMARCKVGHAQQLKASRASKISADTCWRPVAACSPPASLDVCFQAAGGWSSCIFASGAIQGLLAMIEGLYECLCPRMAEHLGNLTTGL